jgi:hypothetical protein
MNWWFLGAIPHAVNVALNVYFLAANGQSWRVVLIVVWCFFLGTYLGRAMEMGEN